MDFCIYWWSGHGKLAAIGRDLTLSRRLHASSFSAKADVLH
jgi:hypothetical protein